MSSKSGSQVFCAVAAAVVAAVGGGSVIAACCSILTEYGTVAPAGTTPCGRNNHTVQVCEAGNIIGATGTTGVTGSSRPAECRQYTSLNTLDWSLGSCDTSPSGDYWILLGPAANGRCCWVKSGPNNIGATVLTTYFTDRVVDPCKKPNCE